MLSNYNSLPNSNKRFLMTKLTDYASRLGSATAKRLIRTPFFEVREQSCRFTEQHKEINPALDNGGVNLPLPPRG